MMLSSSVAMTSVFQICHHRKNFYNFEVATIANQLGTSSVRHASSSTLASSSYEMFGDAFTTSFAQSPRLAPPSDVPTFENFCPQVTACCIGTFLENRTLECLGRTPHPVLLHASQRKKTRRQDYSGPIPIPERTSSFLSGPQFPPA